MNLNRPVEFELTFVSQSPQGRIIPITYQLPKQYDILRESDWRTRHCSSARIDGFDYYIHDEHVRFLTRNNELIMPESQTKISSLKGMILTYVPIFDDDKTHPKYTNRQIQRMLYVHRGIAISFDDALLHYAYQNQTHSIPQILGKKENG